MPHRFPNKQESLLAKVHGRTGRISDKAHEEHLKLYSGYVNKANSILKELEELQKLLDPSNPAHASQIYSTLRSLKIDFSFALGGVFNHEIYFATLGGNGGPPTGRVAELINSSFGTFDLFKRDLKATALAARGWAWTGYDPRTETLFNYIGDSQNTFPVWNIRPILALDVYEHAYYLDFQTARSDYIEEFFNWIDWEAVAGHLNS
jgi:superoxide dismutase, Fe-Mn family